MRYKIFILLSLLSIIQLKSQSLNKSTHEALGFLRNGEIMLAIESLRNASAQNDIVAQYYLALCYEKGIGISMNPNFAFRAMRRVAERGLPDAMLVLSEYYRCGIGTSINAQKQEDWLKRYLSKGGKNLAPDFVALYQMGLKNKNQRDGYANTTEIPIEQFPNKDENGQLLRSLQLYNKQDKVVGNKDNSECYRVDVDINIPQKNVVNSNTFVIIIANEEYQEVDNVEYAYNDGCVFAEYCKLTLGIPEPNIHIKNNATLNNIRKELNWFKKISEAYKSEASFIFYYAGHGVPDEETYEAYLLPIDGSTNDISTGIALKDIYENLANLKSQQTVIFLDACFSGSKRSGTQLTAHRGISIKPKKIAITGQLVVFSATCEDETAHADKENQHGMFTYFLLKALKERQGDISLGELGEYIKDQVSKRSIVINGKSQTPTVAASPTLSNWSSLRLIPN